MPTWNYLVYHILFENFSFFNKKLQNSWTVLIYSYVNNKRYWILSISSKNFILKIHAVSGNFQIFKRHKYSIDFVNDIKNTFLIAFAFRHIILPTTTIIHPPPWYYRFLMNEEAICSNDESMMWCISRVLYGYNEALYLFDVSKRKQKLLKVQRILSSFPEHVFIGWWRSLEVHAAPKNGSRMMIGLRLWTRSFP